MAALVVFGLAGCGSGESSPGDAVHRFAVAGGARTEGPDRITVTTGTQVTIEVTCDATDELHVHGYDKAAPCGPGAPAALAFTADVPGVFEVEMHETGPLTELRVQ
ncbi:hypothetical protein A4R43_13295 [Amycolatopsis albispora]|uniref:EfeO-type cupredoxin-like domain-containing protein n=2 Tax=Amycolatopsis albispora TaxID=1804986 RepID=A0A344LK81_9PSEU|nr:hypothetical protein A4R43_13295 [Amycolatopsis albispora]